MYSVSHPQKLEPATSKVQLAGQPRARMRS
jgi:hypothetical protein